MIAQTAYLAQNKLGFDGDKLIEDQIRGLVSRFQIEHIIETGAYKGHTAKRLINICPRVTTIELNIDNFRAAKKNLKGSGVDLVLGDSGKLLRGYLPDHDRVLLYLDAHRFDSWPLLDELNAVHAAGIQPVIVIHDFRVPDKGFGFEINKGTELNFEYIKNHVEAIYGNRLAYHYNEHAEGAKRGVIYLYAAV